MTDKSSIIFELNVFRQIFYIFYALWITIVCGWFCGLFDAETTICFFLFTLTKKKKKKTEINLSLYLNRALVAYNVAVFYVLKQHVVLCKTISGTDL